MTALSIIYILIQISCKSTQKHCSPETVFLVVSDILQPGISDPMPGHKALCLASTDIRTGRTVPAPTSLMRAQVVVLSIKPQRSFPFLYRNHTIIIPLYNAGCNIFSNTYSNTNISLYYFSKCSII